MDWFREVENRDLPCHLFGYILDAEESNGLYETLDIYFSGMGDGEAELEIPVAPMHYNSAGIVHGGVYSALMDAAMGMAMMTKNKLGVTTSLNVQYLRSAGKGDVLKAFARVEKDLQTGKSAWGSAGYRGGCTVRNPAGFCAVLRGKTPCTAGCGRSAVIYLQQKYAKYIL